MNPVIPVYEPLIGEKDAEGRGAVELLKARM
jgi:hypothetical protein